MRAIYDCPVPSGWQELSLATVAILRRGYTWTKEDEVEQPEPDTVPVIRIPNIQDTLALDKLLHLRNLPDDALQKSAVTKDWILFIGSNGTQNRVGDSVLIEEDRPMVFASFLVGMKPRDTEQLEAEFLARWMRMHLVHETFSKTSQQTTGLANYSWGAVKRLPVRFPTDVAEQQKIAAALRAADDAIVKARAELEATRNLKLSIMDHVFENGLVACVETKPCMIHQCYTAQIPAHWDDEGLGKSLQLVEYGSNAASNDHRGGYPIIAIPQVVAPHLNLTDVPYAEVPESEATALRLVVDDVLLIRTNGNPEYIGKSTIVSKGVADVHTIFASYLIRLRSDKEKLMGAYLNYFLASPLGRRQAGAVANTSAGNNNIGARAIKHFRFPRPPLAEQERAVVLLDGIEAKINAQVEVENALRDVKRSLLENLLTGKLRLPHGTAHA